MEYAVPVLNLVGLLKLLKAPIRGIAATNILIVVGLFSLLACSYDLQVKTADDKNYAVRMSSVRSEEIPAEKVLKALALQIKILYGEYHQCVWLNRYPDESVLPQASDCNSILAHENALKSLLLELEQRPDQLGSQTRLAFRLVVTDSDGRREVKQLQVICSLEKMIDDRLQADAQKQPTREKIKEMVCEKYSAGLAAS
ncbi:MAG: hypothetical protein AB8B70_08800 [Prochlorococcus sp.]